MITMTVRRAAPVLALAALLATAAASPASQARVLSLLAGRPAPGSPPSRARSSGPVTAYVVNESMCAGGHTVTPIRTTTSTALKAIKVGAGANAIAITPDGKTAYVVAGAVAAGTCGQGTPSDTVTPIRTATGKALKAIKVGKDPDVIAITPNGKTAYVANTGSETVTPIRTATGKALKAIKVGNGPTQIAITPNGKTAYVITSSGVVPINTATNKAGKAIKAGSGPGAIAITPDGKTAYVASVRSDTVTPIRTATNTALKAIRIGKATGSAIGSAYIVITPDGKTAYVTIPVELRSGDTPDTVTPIRTATNTAGTAIKVGSGNGPHAIAITPDGKTAYVVNPLGTVTPIRTATNTAGKAIKVTGLLGGIAITPDGKTAYVLDDVYEPGTEPGTVIPIRIATGTVGKAIRVGSGPGAIAFTP